MRDRAAGFQPLILTVIGCLPLGFGALAQNPQRLPGAVPYLNTPPVMVPGNTAVQPSPALPPVPEMSPPATPVVPPTTKSTGDGAIRQRDQELAAIKADQKRASENETKLRQEIETLGADRRELAQQLIETATRVRSVEDEIAKAEERIAPLDEREGLLRQSVGARQDKMAQVLAALQRIGRHPPPALLVRPEEALQSVRSAMLLGTILPEMREETDSLLADLGELVRLRGSIAEERSQLDRDRAALAQETLRLSLMVEQRQKQQIDVEKTLLDESQHAAELARAADNLKDLIAKLEPAPEGAGRASADSRAEAEKKSLDRRHDLAALRDVGRLTPAVAFASAKKQLPLPVNGARIKEYGAPDGVGGTEKGLSIAARPGAQVTAPCDGWVVYAGPFRNYGKLLILNAGGGYHVLLAGMERISVDVGQFVVTGEPVAAMGSRAQAVTAVATESRQPVLYVEFRKDGTPVDPGPWWAASEVEKVRG
jgi:septal ring factor EnvC (AmiA/AmiB activator)